MELVDLMARWLHVIAGIAWIGHLYFFNFVNLPLQGTLDDATKKAVNPKLMPRALWWFRWGAMITFLMGLVLYVLLYVKGGAMHDAAGGMSTRANWIHMGMAFGIVMWFNVWFIIWPAQKKILGGTAGDQGPALAARAKMASRINTYSSGPMLFGMFGGAHSNLVASTGVMGMLGAVVVGLLFIHICYALSTKVGQSV